MYTEVGTYYIYPFISGFWEGRYMEYKKLLTNILNKVYEVSGQNFNIDNPNEISEVVTAKAERGREIKSLIASYRLMLQAEELSHDRS